MSEFPLIKKLGLEVLYMECPGPSMRDIGRRGEAVFANDLERLLGKGVRVFGEAGKPARFWNENNGAEHGDTHTGLLVAIEPIKKESAEDLLRHFVHWTDAGKDELNGLRERARKVLGIGPEGK